MTVLTCPESGIFGYGSKQDDWMWPYNTIYTLPYIHLCKIQRISDFRKVLQWNSGKNKPKMAYSRDLPKMADISVVLWIDLGS